MLNFNSDNGIDVEEMSDLIRDAEANAETDWELNFTDDMRTKLDKYGEHALFSDAQITKLKNIAIACGFWERAQYD